MAFPPTVDEVRAWAGVAPADITDDQIELILWAEEDIQAEYCTFLPDDIPDGELPEALVQSLLRRCARAIAARGVPLGSLPATTSGAGAEYGFPGGRQMYLPRLDAEIARYESAYQLTGIA